MNLERFMRTVLTISHLSITDYTARGQIKTQKLEEGEHQFENVNTGFVAGGS